VPGGTDAGDPLLGGLDEVVDAVGEQVGEFQVLEVGPEAFDRVELGA
jgi:hypothetical protein